MLDTNILSIGIDRTEGTDARTLGLDQDRFPGQVLDQKPMEGIRSDPVMGSDLNEIERLMIEFPIPKRSLEWLGTYQAESETMHASMQCLSENRPK